MKKKVAKRKLRRKCYVCQKSFNPGDVYYIDRKIFREHDEVIAVEGLICPKCLYKQNQHEKRYKKFQEKCTHPDKFVEIEYCYFPNDPVPVPSRWRCRLCGKNLT